MTSYSGMTIPGVEGRGLGMRVGVRGRVSGRG